MEILENAGQSGNKLMGSLKSIINDAEKYWKTVRIREAKPTRMPRRNWNRRSSTPNSLWANWKTSLLQKQKMRQSVQRNMSRKIPGKQPVSLPPSVFSSAS